MEAPLVGGNIWIVAEEVDIHHTLWGNSVGWRIVAEEVDIHHTLWCGSSVGYLDCSGGS